MELNKKKILVTGADGFIGSHLTEMLLAKGNYVKSVTLSSTMSAGVTIDPKTFT